MFQTLTIVGGLITASSLIVARKPGAKELFRRIAPYQGFLGLAMLAMGILWLVRWMPNLGASFSSLGGALVLGMIAANILIGFLMGFSLLSGVLARNETAKAKSEILMRKLMNAQIPLGVSAVAMGVASFVL